MRNGVAYTAGFDKIVQERFQKVCRGIGRRTAPIYSSVDHFTFKPAPYDEGPAYLSVKIFKCWSKLAHPVILHYHRYRAPNADVMT